MKKLPHYRRVVEPRVVEPRVVEPQLDAMAARYVGLQERLRGNVHPTHLLMFVSQIIISI